MDNEGTSQPGKIEFRCTCGTLFRVDAKLAGRKERCKTCGVSLLIPEGQADVANVVDKAVRLASQASAHGGGEEDVDIQRLCGICQCDIEPDDEIIECPECGLPYHADCWSENLGCSAYGCLQVNKLKAGPDIRVESTHAGTAISSQRGQAADADIPWEFMFLAASALAFLIGLVSYGIPSLLLLFGTIAFAATKFRHEGDRSLDRKRLNWSSNWKPIALLAISLVVSLAGFIIGLISSLKY